MDISNLNTVAESKKEKKKSTKTVNLAQPKSQIFKRKKSKLISFDVFFNMAMKSNPSIKLHHKVPMKVFMEKHGNVEAQTQVWFKSMLDKYL